MKKILTFSAFIALIVFAGFFLTVKQRSEVMALANETFSLEREIDRKNQDLLKTQIKMDDMYFTAAFVKRLAETLEFVFVNNQEYKAIRIIETEIYRDD
ncbi:hypothetical protein JW890_06230 [candidate division WOR-3 bacterium]|nr:hypothetical protein [candidate division WOR-3 bacterium]